MMSESLQQLNIFELRPLITNISCKLSTVTEYDARKQILCLVSEENDIVLRYTNDTGQEILKMISWFRRTNRVIHGVCFDPSGTWLLVLCFDNTLHIVPALAVVDKNFTDATDAACPKQPYSTTQVTSYIIPFVGPHECPNSKKCPNHNPNDVQQQQLAQPSTSTLEPPQPQLENVEQPMVNEVQHLVSGLSKLQLQTDETASRNRSEADIEAFSHDVPRNMLASETPPVHSEDKTGNSQVMANSFMASNTCPYPLTVVWWQTGEGINRAIIGYSDGSICFVGLSPNCPFVASTAIKRGSAVKLIICRDNSRENVILLISNSLKRQYRLVLEQKALKYIYPGDISPTTTQTRESDWQIVLPVKSESNCSDPASDNSMLDEDVFVKDDEAVPTVCTAAAATAATTTITDVGATQLQPNVAPNNVQGYVSSSEMPPPPPYSVAISRHVESVPATSSRNGGGATVDVTELDDFNGRGGILPAARARLASLKSLGTKKLNAIKMRLSDNRHKLSEYIPDSPHGSFAIIDVPKLTPELVKKVGKGYFSMQNLRSTYLLSALHVQNKRLSIHNVDIRLKPLFSYYIPKNCIDILISSNLLYTIQDIEATNDRDRTTISDKEAARSTDAEKEEKSSSDDDAEDDRDVDDDDDDADDGDAMAKSSAIAANVSTSNDGLQHQNLVNAVGVISSAYAAAQRDSLPVFNKTAMLGLFRFEHETVLNLYQMATYPSSNSGLCEQEITKEEKMKAFEYKDIRKPMDYVKFYENIDVQDEHSLRQMEIMKSEFPKINYDPCYVITNRNVYYIQLKKEPYEIFLDAVTNDRMTQCREFCNIFDVPQDECMEFVGDYYLRRNNVTKALCTFNTARIKPLRTALKLAMYGQMMALMHLCAMALKCTYIIKSKHFCHPIINSILSDITYRHSEDVRQILPPLPSDYASNHEVVNEGEPCSSYVYNIDESMSNLQMSLSSQFHLANLLLITLAERAVHDKNYIPIWNFLVTNTKYHTNMTSIVLCQSGFYSSALILAKIRGVCIDVFAALTSVVGQAFGWYTEMNVCLYNLSEPMFMETLTYMPQVSIEYFGFIHDKLDDIRHCVLKRLEEQLNPFAAILRPIVSHTSSGRLEQNRHDNNTYLFEFCKNLIETYLAVIIHMESQRTKHREHITNALSTFRIIYEDNQFAIDSTKFKPISAGCAHCACIVDGVAYFWGSNGVPCNYSASKSSEPPEPTHVVKRLELLSQLNLEVHAVKCGRLHTLILTNNGLYAFGNNNLLQLGIGKHLNTSLQPMLVKAFDGKNITVLEAGQYHNAAVADGLLYTWGWGVYGQLGHGDTENVAEPKLVNFFKYKKVAQVSLGHAHSLVLCQLPDGNTELYVFGSNHFGQLGLGGPWSVRAAVNGNNNAPASDDEMNECSSHVKSLIPLKLYISTLRIRLIHTKFFTNLAIDENENMYTWGSSPQAIRLANQIKRRASARQKYDEHQRRDISRRFAATLSRVVRVNDNTTTTTTTTTTEEAATSSAVENPPTGIAIDELTSNEQEIIINAIIGKKASEEEDNTNVIVEDEDGTILEGPSTSAEASAAVVQVEVEDDNGVDDDDNDDDEEVVQKIANMNVEIIEDDTAAETTKLPTTENNDAESNQTNITNVIVEDIIDDVAVDAATIIPNEPDGSHEEEEEAEDSSKPKKRMPAELYMEPLAGEHMTPHLVDTSNVAGQILQVSSGLFHFAIISSTCTLYTWGKNLEHQLGTEDKERRAVNRPSPIDSIEQPMYVDCGADFTLVMTTDYVVKAFGGNSNGQCGRDLGPCIDKAKHRVVCLPTTKRLMRFESQCIEAPIEINLPRPCIRLDSEPVRYLKSIPRYQPHFVQDAGIDFVDETFEVPSPSSQQYKSTTQADTSDNAITGQDSDDQLSSLDNLSNNDASPMNLSCNPLMPTSAAYMAGDTDCNNSCSNEDDSHEEQSYTRLPTTDNADQSVAVQQLHSNNNNNGNGNAMKTQENEQEEEAEGEQTRTTITADTDEDDDDTVDLQELRHYIHYCLYVFHGLYNPDKIRDFAKGRLEYRIRTQMLNFKFIDAFTLCLKDCGTPKKSLKIFEYFTKDTGFVPMRRQDLKYLIYYLLWHFLRHKFDMLECERFFLADLDYYLLELAYVLYFNNNNTVLEQNLNEKFKGLIAQEDDNSNQNANEHHKLEDTDVIFDSLSVKFKTIVCQRLLKHCNN